MASKKTNEVPIAPFNLRETGPLSLPDAYKACGNRWFVAAQSAQPAVDEATVDKDHCPDCKKLYLISCVEWAATVKYGPNFKNDHKDLARYVYARCQTNPKGHRWGFREFTKASQKPAQPLIGYRNCCKDCNRIFTCDEPTTKLCEICHIKRNVEKRPLPTPAPIPLTQEATPDMTATSNPFGAFELWLEEKIGARLEAAETQLDHVIKNVAAIKPAVEKDQIAELIHIAVDEATKNLHQISITIPSMPTAKFEGVAHPKLQQVLRYVAAGERFFLLVGPAATGKSTLAGQVAQALKLPYCAVSITQTVMREDLLGCTVHNLTTGTASYKATALVETWESDGVICIDECDRGDPNTLTCFNPIEQGALYVPRPEKPLATSSKAIVIATANTYGTGASRVYVGANQLDAAFTDRFRIVDVGYDRDLEVAICGGDSVAKEAVTFMEAARTRADNSSVRRPLTTRMIRRAVTDVRLSNNTLTAGAAMRASQCAGWTQTEINTVFPS